MSLAHALQSYMSVDTTENKDGYFHDAMDLLDDCLLIAQDIFGTMSFKVAQVHRLRSATYLSKKMYFNNYFFLFQLMKLLLFFLGIMKLKNN